MWIKFRWSKLKESKTLFHIQYYMQFIENYLLKYEKIKDKLLFNHLNGSCKNYYELRKY